MGKSVMFVCNASSFMVNVILGNLKTAGFEVYSIEATIKQINENIDDVDIVVLYLGNYLYMKTDVLSYLKTKCNDKAKSIVTIGNPEENNAVKDIITNDVVSARFERPLDIKEFVSRVDELVAKSQAYDEQKTILLVDDDGDFLKLMRGWLNKKYKVVILNSGEQALEYLEDNRPDLVLLDYEMPGLNGPQVMDSIRNNKKTRTLPIIFLTGKNDKDVVMEVLEQKPDGYLLKSEDRQFVVDAVDRFFNSRKWKV